MPRRALPGGYELDDDRARIDVDAVYGFLSAESYWARGRTREQVQRSIDGASRVVGLYDAAGRQIGHARVLSDDLHVAYLADVFVLDPHRGKGLGVELVREAVDHGPHAKLNWWLATADAHGLYERFGFGRPPSRFMTREKAR